MLQLDLYSYVLKEDSMENSNFVVKKFYTNFLISLAADGIFKTLDKDLQKKYNVAQIEDLIKKSDKDKNGIITMEEAKKDIDNIFGLQLSDNTDRFKKVQESVDEKMKLRHIKGLQLGLENWGLAKSKTIERTSNQDIKNMFFNEDNVKYYSETIGKDTKINKHLVELFKARDITLEDIEQMGFSEDVLNDILKYYEDKD